MKKGVESGSISQRYGCRDPDPHQDVRDPQHWKKTRIKVRKADLLSARYVNVKEGQHLAELAGIAEACRHPALHQELNHQGNLKQITDIKLYSREIGIVLQSLRSLEVYSHIYYVSIGTYTGCGR